MDHQIRARTQVTLVLTMTPNEARSILRALDMIDKPIPEGQHTNFTYEARKLYGALREVSEVPEEPVAESATDGGER